MTNQQAAAKAKKRWGKVAYARNGGSMSSPERRAEARQIVLDARAEIKEIGEEITRRLNELDWYQELVGKRREAQKRVSKTEGYAHYYRFSVGKRSGFFNEIVGQGDTWEEAFAMAEGKENRAA